MDARFVWERRSNPLHGGESIHVRCFFWGGRGREVKLRRSSCVRCVQREKTIDPFSPCRRVGQSGETRSCLSRARLDFRRKFPSEGKLGKTFDRRPSSSRGVVSGRIGKFVKPAESIKATASHSSNSSVLAISRRERYGTGSLRDAIVHYLERECVHPSSRGAHSQKERMESLPEKRSNGVKQRALFNLPPFLRGVHVPIRRSCIDFPRRGEVMIHKA